MNALRCPTCKADNTAPPRCRRCKSDLAALFELEADRSASLSQARACLANGDLAQTYSFARLVNELREDDESLRLLAVASLLVGRFHDAWEIYRQLRGTTHSERE